MFKVVSTENFDKNKSGRIEEDLVGMNSGGHSELGMVSLISGKLVIKKWQVL